MSNSLKTKVSLCFAVYATTTEAFRTKSHAASHLTKGRSSSDRSLLSTRGSTVELNLGGEGYAGGPGSKDSKSFKWNRNVYMKHLRCKEVGWSEESCEECAGSEDCWSAGGTGEEGYQQLIANGWEMDDGSQKGWKQYVSYADLPLDGRVKIKKMEGKYHNLEVTWDSNGGTRISINPRKDKDDLPACGMNRFSLVHKVTTEDKESQLKVEPVVLEMDSDQLGCYDDDLCFNELGIDDEGIELRSSNVALKDCLKGRKKGKSGACKRWRDCMSERPNRNKHRKRILHMLKAVLNDVDMTSSFIQSNTTDEESSSGKKESQIQRTYSDNSVSGCGAQEDRPGECKRPDIGDPLSQCCSCASAWDNAMALCKAEPWKCFRARICAEPNVCQSWKDAANCDAYVKAHLLEEESSGDASDTTSDLETRAVSTSGGSALEKKKEAISNAQTMLESSMGRKQCV